MSTITIPIYFDYASTLCYIAWRIVRDLEGELGFEALWKGVPIAMRDFRARPGLALGEREHGKVLIASAETGVAVKIPARWLDSDAALRGSELAREAGRFRPFHQAVFEAAFERGEDIGRLEVLGELAERCAIPALSFVEQLRTGAMADRIAAHKSEADAFSALGYPTFILGDYPLIGIQPAETMRMLLRRFIEQRAAEPQA